jgi:hypothetical protein
VNKGDPITLDYGGIVVEVSAPEHDMVWLRLLFARTAAPFRILRDMGYEVVDREESVSPTRKEEP